MINHIHQLLVMALKEAGELPPNKEVTETLLRSNKYLAESKQALILSIERSIACAENIS